MKTAIVVSTLFLLMLTGCGVNKDYVNQQIQESEARTGSKIGSLSDKADANAAEIAKLQGLARDLSDKTAKAINDAAGFENYQVIWEGTINFDFDSYEITSTAEEILMNGCAKMEQVPRSLMEIVGHTDRTGSSSYNMLLGEKRASSAKTFMAQRCGVSLYRLFIASYGETLPVALPDEQQASSRNRRVTLKVWGPLQ